ncbi:MAG: type I DNA topoisomerase [Clostridia bacterium]|nr:type I DNA topoisomerase [Clostridia bacterium]
MANLVIVESPSKANTIKGYLGQGFKVMASKGHVRDLPKSTLGVDIDAGFEPNYITIRGKGDVISALKKEAKKADVVYLATDPDREGEAISWHLVSALDLQPEKVRRAAFHELTKTAVRSAIKNPGTIDLSLVNSQQARRILDRILGYKISPLLWKKVKSGLSAGRVQSVTTRLVVDREKEIRDFVAEEYWTIEANLVGDAKKAFSARFFGRGAKKMELTSKEAADEVLSAVRDAAFFVRDIKQSKKVRHPAPPFTTSQLQQDAFRRLSFQSQRTMRVAQELYEGVQIKGRGSHGLITYMRTDSLRVSADAQSAARDYIAARYGAEFVPEKPPFYKTKSGAQDAHEAIRPTDLSLTPESIKASLTPEQYRLYKLIFDRFVASQMANALIDVTSVDIDAAGYTFRVSGEVIRFRGFLSAYADGEDEEETKKEAKLPPMQKGEALTLNELLPEQNFTQPPSRYTEGTLVRAMEEMGIGRPSTFAPTIATIISRGYVSRVGKFLAPSALGEVTNEWMVRCFAPIIDYKFTADMEASLDRIAEGKEDYKRILSEFYEPFAELLAKAEAQERQEKIAAPPVELDIKCEKCGSTMVLKHGRFGAFAACPNYPECKNTLPLDKSGKVAPRPEAKKVEGMKCEICGKDVYLKRGRYGEFYACEDYPTCRFTKPVFTEAGVPCPKCGGKVVLKRSPKNRSFYGCENYPKCDFSSWDLPTEKKCPLCGDVLLRRKKGDELYCRNKTCKHTEASK